MLRGREQILVVDDEPNLRRVLGAQLARDGYEVHTAADGEEALAILAEHHLDLVITDLRMPKVDGMALLRRCRELDDDLPVVLMTAHGTVDTAVEALKTGAFDYVTKPFDQDEVRHVVRKALRTRAFSETHVSAEGDPAGRFGIVGESSRLREVFEVLARVADTPTTVLITGESGTGKELVARALHDHSSRKTQPFIRVNAAALPKDLVESELFGYEKGAFTGAMSAKPGRFELANGGTLLLDEIGAVPTAVQVKLLRALQEGEIERVGGVRTLPVDVRVVAATNADLRDQLASGTFREDLYYRLNVVRIHLPPLRERTDDLALLARHFIARSNKRLGKHVESVSPAASAALAAYAWPGNIRELENAIERAVLFCDGDLIEPSHLPVEVTEPARAAQMNAASVSNAPVAEGLREQVRAAVSRVERQLIQRALEQTSGNVTHAARLLKVSRKGLQLKMKELELRER